MDSNTNKQTEEVDAPPIASKPEKAISDLTTSINETTEQGQSPAISAEVSDFEKAVEVLIPKLGDDQENRLSKEGNNLEKVVDTSNSKEAEENLDKLADTDSVKDDNSQSSSKKHENVDSESVKAVDKSDKPKLRRYKLNKSARKRRNLLVKKGYTVKEARKYALLPMSIVRELKIVPGESSETQPETKKPKISTSDTTPKKPSQGYEVSSSSSTYTPSTGKNQVGIMSKDYPEELLSTEKLKSIEATILERIVTQKEGEVKPKFLGTSFKLGFMVISCADKATSDWLKNAIDKIKPWNEASLVTVSKDKIPREQILHGYFFNSTDDTNEKILGFIGAQNDGLKVKEWRVIERKEDETAVHLVFSADNRSVENLKKHDFKINYKFSQVYIRLKDPPKPTQNKPVPKVENKQAYSSRSNRHTQSAKASRRRARDPWHSYTKVGSTSRIDPTIFHNQ